MPTMVPLWVHYPADTATYDAEDQWLIGRDLLVHPVTAKARTARAHRTRAAHKHRPESAESRST